MGLAPARDKKGLTTVTAVWNIAKRGSWKKLQSLPYIIDTGSVGLGLTMPWGLLGVTCLWVQSVTPYTSLLSPPLWALPSSPSGRPFLVPLTAL